MDEMHLSWNQVTTILYTLHTYDKNKNGHWQRGLLTRKRTPACECVCARACAYVFFLFLLVRQRCGAQIVVNIAGKTKTGSPINLSGTSVGSGLNQLNTYRPTAGGNYIHVYNIIYVYIHLHIIYTCIICARAQQNSSVLAFIAAVSSLSYTHDEASRYHHIIIVLSGSSYTYIPTTRCNNYKTRWPRVHTK
jgi:hypothetical protein